MIETNGWDENKSRPGVAELEGLDFVETPVAVKIADLMPKYPNDVHAIFAKERVPLDAGRIAAVLDIVDRYR